jgi:hypothetical protein
MKVFATKLLYSLVAHFLFPPFLQLNKICKKGHNPNKKIVERRIHMNKERKRVCEKE